MLAIVLAIAWRHPLADLVIASLLSFPAVGAIKPLGKLQWNPRFVAGGDAISRC